MRKWYQVFPKSTGLSPYVWLVFGILPFYFIFRSSDLYKIVIGIVLISLFFFCYRLTFVSKGWPVYVGTSVQIIISITMSILYGYIYFSFFLAFFIGNVQNKAGFFTLYTIHLVSVVTAVNIGFVSQNRFFLTQTPFILICLIGAILLPLSSYNRNKQEQLEDQLHDANLKIADMVKLEERQRIARDLHDTLGQKLSLIGLKSDLAGKLIYTAPERARSEIKEIQQTARTALKEVREMVSQMRGTRLKDELRRVKQILHAAQIEFHLEGSPVLAHTSLLVENVLSMCLKEAVNNIIKHSNATACTMQITETSSQLVMKVSDNGNGFHAQSAFYEGHGLQGMKERLEFVNGSLDIDSRKGTTLTIQVPLLQTDSAKG
ncbi:sensor histidine kinase [Paenibacillus senegalensis]|uniref:sensor histidine kinase n=1 Tax=Paenibacillus senegalensis TaxID=1465766 RepID=UPI00028909DC|nr:sensor histidine kinase [Paenibacillus senegalensis]